MQRSTQIYTVVGNSKCCNYDTALRKCYPWMGGGGDGGGGGGGGT